MVVLEVAKESVVTHIAFAEDARAVRLSAETPTTFSYGVIDTQLRLPVRRLGLRTEGEWGGVGRVPPDGG